MRDRTATGSATGSSPKTRTKPLSARSRPRICLMSVVLPAPLAPTRPWTAPRDMDRLTEARAVLAPKRRVSSDTLTTDSFIVEPQSPQAGMGLGPEPHGIVVGTSRLGDRRSG